MICLSCLVFWIGSQNPSLHFFFLFLLSKKQFFCFFTILLFTSLSSFLQVLLLLSFISFFSFNFDYIFGPNSTQQDIYDNCAKKSVENFLLGYNSAIIIHGQNNSGKSYTMYGKNDDNNLKGIISRVFI